jgi:glycosyltransferase involved in cell wall biosynthesis
VVPRLNIGGAETYVATLARNLKQRQYEVVLASWGGRLARALTNEGIPHYHVPIRWSARFSAALLKRIIMQERIDLVHANSADAGIAAYLACRGTHVPWIITAHGRILHNQRKYDCVQDAHKVICVSEFLRGDICANTAINPEKLITVVNGVDLQHFSPAGQYACIRQQCGVRPEDFVIGIVSRVYTSHRKGHVDLLNILAHYPVARSWRLMVVGTGHGLGKVKALAHRLGVADRVIFVGHCMNVAGLFEAMDVVALPSVSETFGLVISEAMAMGKPVVTYAVGGTPEVVDDGRSGFLVPLGNVDRFAECLHTLATDPARAARMGAAGRERVERLFDLRQMAGQITAIYDDVLGRQPLMSAPLED